MPGGCVSWTGCFTELELSTTATGTVLFSGEAEDREVVTGLLTWEDGEVGLVVRVGAETENGPGRAGLFSPPEIPSVGVPSEPIGSLLCPTEEVILGAETGVGGLASGAKTKTGGSAGWEDLEGGCTGTSGAETKAGTSVEAGAALL